MVLIDKDLFVANLFARGSYAGKNIETAATFNQSAKIRGRFCDGYI